MILSVITDKIEISIDNRRYKIRLTDFESNKIQLQE